MALIRFDRWTFLKLIELVLAIVCLTYKRITDDEASRLFLYLQRISREWSLLNNVTWDRIGAAVADATYGGYVIITAALFIGRLFQELPTHKRITECVLLGVGAILFIVIGSLEFAALDQVPPDLVDNAAVIGTLTLIEGILFIIDMGGPKAKKTPKSGTIVQKEKVVISKPHDPKKQVAEMEKEVERVERSHFEMVEEKPKKKKDKNNEGIRNGHVSNGQKNGDEIDGRRSQKGYRKMSGEVPKRYGIYGKDMADSGGSETDEPTSIPPKMETHSPVWSQIRKGEYGKYDPISPSYIFPKGIQRPKERPPSSPGDPGFVQYTAQHWGHQPSQKTPRHSPTEV